MKSAPTIKVKVKVGSLVLHDAPGAQAGALAAALKAELGRLLQQPEALAALASGPARRSHIDAGTFRSVSPASDGAAIARNVHRGLTGGTRR